MTLAVRNLFVLAASVAGFAVAAGARAADPALSTAAVAARSTDETGSLNPHLESLRPLLGKTWKGVFKNSTPERPVADVARWERALNGNAIRILHSINDGIYGGETLVTWNEQKQAIVTHYFTTAGFMTTGTMTVEGDRLITYEKIDGPADGVTEVKGTCQLISDGKFIVKSEHLKDGVWEPGHEATYEEAPDAKVVFQ